MNIRTSVVIPLYNSRKYIRSTVESVLSQSYPVHEIIVIDDGSTDGSGETLFDYIMSGAVKYILQMNQGVSVARNTGVSASTGNYVAFLDSDDIWLPTKNEEQINFLKMHKDIEFVHNDVTLIDCHGNKITSPVFHRFDAKGHCLEHIIKYCAINISSILVSKRLLNEVGKFNKSLHGSEDYEFFMRVGLKYEVGYVDNKLTYYRKHNTSATSSRITILHEAIKALESMGSNPELNRKMMSTIRLQKGQFHFMLAQRHYHDFCDRKQSLKSIVRSLRYKLPDGKTMSLLANVMLPSALIKNVRWYAEKIERYCGTLFRKT